MPKWYIDPAFKVPVTRMGDGGDSLARLGELGCAMWLIGQPSLRGFDLKYDQEDLRIALNASEVKPGVFCRHPTKWPDPYDFKNSMATSRDQTDPIVILAGYMGDIGILGRTFKAILKNKMRYPNNDLCGPESWARFIRAFFCALSEHSITMAFLWGLAMYLPLCVLDVFTLGNGVIRSVKGYLDPDDCGDDILHCLTILQEQQTIATPTGWLGRVIYFISRPWSGPKEQPFLTEQIEKFKAKGVHRVTSPIAWYHEPKPSGDGDGNPFHLLFNYHLERIWHPI